MESVLNVFDTVKNKEVYKSILATYSKLSNPRYSNVMCSISGGSDSDILLDICTKLDTQEKVSYVWMNTGLEFDATKRHLEYLSEKYGIEIQKVKAKKSIATCCKEYGQPFLSKQVSEYIFRLQGYGFQWEDEPLEVLLERYCSRIDESDDYEGCKTALQWWCNEKGEGSMFNISRNKYLKEFFVAIPPYIAISNKCCHFTKKAVKHDYIKENNIDLSIVGVRKAEGGVRSAAYKSCFTDNGPSAADEFRPIFWYKDSDKKEYEESFDVVHSDCYTKYGLKRTGCAGCPFGRDLEAEVEATRINEPKLYKAIINIFGDSYEYTRLYNEFRVLMEELEGVTENKSQMQAKLNSFIEKHKKPIYVSPRNEKRLKRLAKKKSLQQISENKHEFEKNNKQMNLNELFSVSCIDIDYQTRPQIKNKLILKQNTEIYQLSFADLG